MNPREFQDALIQAGVPGETAHKAATEIARYVEECVSDPDSWLEVAATIDQRLDRIERRLTRLDQHHAKLKDRLRLVPIVVTWLIISTICGTIILMPIATSMWRAQYLSPMSR